MDVTFEGEAGAKTLVFKTSEGLLFKAAVIGAQEADAWKACEAMLAHAVQTAAAKVKGFYGLEILSVSLGEGAKHFEAGAFAQWIANQAAALEAGARRVFPYGGFLLRLHKRIPEDWGKIDLKTYVEVFRKPRGELDLWIKKKAAAILKDERYAAEPKTLEIEDLGQDSLFRFGEEPQTERLAAFLKKNRPAYEAARLKILFRHPQNGGIDLFERFGMPLKPQGESCEDSLQ